jgi:UDP-glucose 4-epimerase
MNQIMQARELTIFGDGTQTRAFSYIDDVAIPIARSVTISEAYNEVFNIGADKPYSVNELAKVVSEHFSVEPNIKYLSARNEVLHAYSDHSKAHKVFGQPSALDLKEGIKRMAEWAKKVGARTSKEFDDIEITEKLPDGWGMKNKKSVG